MTIAEKLEWLAAAENFLNLGNVTGAMNALREILTAAQFSRDPDTLAFAAELSFYRGDTAAAEDYLGQLTEAASRTGGEASIAGENLSGPSWSFPALI